jgi:cold shock CspA family protein
VRNDATCPIYLVGVNLPGNMYSKGGTRMTDSEISKAKKICEEKGFGFIICDERREDGIFDTIRVIIDRVQEIRHQVTPNEGSSVEQSIPKQETKSWCSVI